MVLDTLRPASICWCFPPCRALPSRASSSGLISAFSFSMWNSSWFWVALLISVCFNLPSITFSWESFCDACRPWRRPHSSYYFLHCTCILSTGYMTTNWQLNDNSLSLPLIVYVVVITSTSSFVLGCCVLKHISLPDQLGFIKSNLI